MRRVFSIAATLAMLFVIVAPFPAAAYNIFSGADCSGKGANSAVCQDSNGGDPDPIGGPRGALWDITNIIALLAGIAAIIIIIVSGLRYITSGGDSANVASARKTLIGALIGLAVIVMARSLIIFVIGRLEG